ncbi:Alpha/Beta hydrolase protein [Spinellus fusiger]|nr:Alpha/Beta hydrolase protein [Spinellus fusiger]
MKFMNISRVCSVEGCCQIMTRQPSLLEKVSTPLHFGNITPSLVPHEMCQTFLSFPKGVYRFVSDVWSHLAGRPKRPTWNLAATVIISMSQIMRDIGLYHNIAYWRILFAFPLLFFPLSCHIEESSFPVKQYQLHGILKKADEEETNNRHIYGEWIACQSQHSSWISSTNFRRLLNLISFRKHSSVQRVHMRPKSNEKVILYIHGGGLCFLSAKLYRFFLHKLSKKTGRRVFAINYRLAPETRFPGALYDTIQAFLHLIDPVDGYSLSPENIIIMGDSAGGGLCLSTMLYLRDHYLPQVGGCTLLSPWVDMTYSHPSWGTSSTFDVLPSRPGILNTINPAAIYLGPEQYTSMRNHPYVSPIFAENFENLPPILIQSGSCETLRDEIREIVRRIKLSKTTQVHHEEYKDMIHVFQVFPLSKSPEATESIGAWITLGLPILQQKNIHDTKCVN